MPRPNPFAFTTCATLLFNPVLLPFLAPRVFAPWPKELGQRYTHSYKTPRQERRAETLRALEATTLEDSYLLGAALGENVAERKLAEAKEKQTHEYLQQRWDSINGTGKYAKVHTKHMADDDKALAYKRPAQQTGEQKLRNTSPQLDAARGYKSDQEKMNTGTSDISSDSSLANQFHPSNSTLWNQSYQEPSDKWFKTSLLNLKSFYEEIWAKWPADLLSRPRDKVTTECQIHSLTNQIDREWWLHIETTYRQLTSKWFEIKNSHKLLLSRLARHQQSKKKTLASYKRLKKPLDGQSEFARYPQPKDKPLVSHKRLKQPSGGQLEKVLHLDLGMHHQMIQHDGPQLVEMYHEYRASNNASNEFTQRWFVKHLAQKGETKTAIEALGALYEDGIDFSQPWVTRICSTLLLNKYRKDLDAPPTDFELFDRMVACGLQPDCTVYNILMHNSAQRNDHDSVLQIYEEMKEKGVGIDGFTYSILINEAKYRRDFETVQAIFLAAHESQNLDKYVLADLLHAIYILQRQHLTARRSEQPQEEMIDEESMEAAFQEDTNSVLKPMLDFYCQYFVTQPFLDLIPPNRKFAIPVLNEGLFDSQKNRLLMPDAAILHIMLAVLLRSSHRGSLTLDYYRHFQKLVEEQHPVALMLCNDNAVYNLFLNALGKWEETLGTCAEVLQNMMSPVTGSKREVQPTVVSWSILVKAFMQHRQPLAAEKVLKMMNARGLAPTHVTWRYLVNGYARLQDIGRALDARDRMAMDGWELKAEQTKLDRLIRNKDALHRTLLQRSRSQEFDEEYLEEYRQNESSDDFGHTHAKEGLIEESDEDSYERLNKNWEAQESIYDAENLHYEHTQ